MTDRAVQMVKPRIWLAGALVLVLAALLFLAARAVTAPSAPAPAQSATLGTSVPVTGPQDYAEPDSALLVSLPEPVAADSGSTDPSEAALTHAATAVPQSDEQPEVAAYDTRGLHLFWPAWGPISTYFHEAGPYWVGGYHQGLDIAALWGEPVRAAYDGQVVTAAEGWNKGYGTMILIDHYNGFFTRYGHLSTMFVKQGDRVHAGDLIGLIGSTGAAEGPHLHFEVIVDGQLRDPLEFLPTLVDRPTPTRGHPKAAE